MRFSIMITILMPICIAFFFLRVAAAQHYPGLDPTLRSGDRRAPLFREGQSVAPEPEIVAPPLPEKDAPPDKKVQMGPRIAIFATQIRTVGNKAFSDAELAAVTRPFIDRTLYYEDLEQVRRALTLHYVRNGYVNSGAVLPDQTVSDGVVTYVIVEGKLAEIQMAGNRWLRKGFYEKRIRQAAGPPLNIRSLEGQLQMLQQHALIERAHAELKPGLSPGESILALEVEERAPFDAWIGFNNYQSPSVGAERGLVSLTHHSLTGNGDVLSLTYGRSEGLDPLFDISYRLPVTHWDTELGLRYRVNDFDIVEEPFQDLDIESESEIVELQLRQPVWRTPSQEFAVGLSGERLHSQSWVMDEPFSFSPGSNDGEATVAALRFFQDYLYRTQKQVVAVHSRFSLGLDVMDATTNGGDEPDGQFFSWRGQFQWAGIMDPLGVQAIFRTDLQLSNDHLLVLEQLPVGGRHSVRGYRENQMVRDNGVVSSLEARIPLVRGASWADYLHLAPFVDYANAWNTESSTPEPRDLWSVGIGLRWALTFMTTPFPMTSELEVYWGHPLKDVHYDGDDIQDDGIHFQLAISAF